MSERQTDPFESLRRLEARLDQASEAAERLLSDAARSIGGRTPSRGWQVPSAASEPVPGLGEEAQQLVQAALGLRELIPPEIQRRLADALRDLLLAVRALIDWYLERAARAPDTAPEAQDIPIL